MLSFNLDIKKKYEMWSRWSEPLRFSPLEFENLTGLNREYIEDLETPNVALPEMVSFTGDLWEFIWKLGQPSTIMRRPKRCGIGPVEDRRRLAYLSIFLWIH
ncbi:hypothetical protein Bca52824_054584 [Brassica carinata]|uniref:Uncharacterized protein n=1 Tax=Brassica carinata TaxID=52824 RepID=A0A8X7ULZ2_BRACI|nr:hypothetical protein Bca52824_054584 [Brassica carinata]